MHCIPGCSFILSSRNLTQADVRHIGRFRERLRDRELMSAVIHFGTCRNRACIARNGEVQRLLAHNLEIPVTIIAVMEYWRAQTEGFWPRQAPPTGPEKSG